MSVIPSKDWTASPKIRQFICRREGVVLVHYRDGEGFSVGAGHYLGKEVPKKGISPLTLPEALHLLKEDVAKREPQVKKAVKVPLQQHQFDALLDLLYQGGNDGLLACAKIANDRDPSIPGTVLTSDREVAREMLAWDVDASGKHLPGLLKRRAREVSIWAAEDYGSDLDQVPVWRQVDQETHKPRGQDRVWMNVKESDFS